MIHNEPRRLFAGRSAHELVFSGLSWPNLDKPFRLDAGNNSLMRLFGANIIHVVWVGAQKLPAGTASQPYQDGSVILHTTLPGGSQAQLNEGLTLGASVCPERYDISLLS